MNIFIVGLFIIYQTKINSLHSIKSYSLIYVRHMVLVSSLTFKNNQVRDFYKYVELNANIRHHIYLLGDPWIKVHHDCDVIPDAIKSKLMKSIDIQPTRPKNILATRVSEVI